jgi:hypothetical protein
MKTTGFFAITALILLAISQSGVAQDAGHRKGEGMGGHKMSATHVLITHKVGDADKWMAAWSGEDSRHAIFRQNGVKHVHVMQDPNNPNVTGLIVAVTDMEKFKAFLESEEGQAAAAEDTVIWDSMVMLVEKK